MSRIPLAALATTVLLTAAGCASTNRIVGHDLTQVGRWYGELGITGHLNKITVQSRSRLTKLSIIGDANKILVEEGATLAKIEVWGSNNTISIAEHLVIRVSQVGQGNQLIRRPHQPAETVEPLVEPADEQAELPAESGDAPE